MSIPAMKLEESPSAALPRHVLVVDDSRAQRHMVSMQLRRWGYRVTECDSALSALRLCSSQDIDIIISERTLLLLLLISQILAIIIIFLTTHNNNSQQQHTT